MLRLTDIKLPLDHAEGAIEVAIRAKLGLGKDALRGYTVFRRGYDARKRNAIQLIYTLDVDVADEATILKRHADDKHVQPTPDTSYHFVAQAPAPLSHRPIVIGTGPCGLFAGLLLAQMGFRPIILDRGKAVRERTVDTWGLWRKRKLESGIERAVRRGRCRHVFRRQAVQPDLATRKHHGRKVLAEFVKAGAPEEILYVSKPHIGTFRLVTMVENMRATIEALGGEIRFQQRVDDVLVESGCRGRAPRARRGAGQRRAAAQRSCRPGHRPQRPRYLRACCTSAACTWSQAVLDRLPHRTSAIDHRSRALRRRSAGHPILGAADYKLVHHATGHQGRGRSVYSFCMCPGGTVVAATSEPGRVVTNGMSQYSRNERNANAAIVVGIDPSDFAAFDDSGSVLAGIALQRALESHAFELGGGTYDAPAQLVGDFIAGKPSRELGSVQPSYKPGVHLD